MCAQPHGWMTFICWLANDWDDWVARAVLLLLAAVLLSLLIGTLARALRFFEMDEDDVRRLPPAERVRPIDKRVLTPDEPGAPR